jgi:hypothetical protein
MGAANLSNVSAGLPIIEVIIHLDMKHVGRIRAVQVLERKTREALTCRRGSRATRSPASACPNARMKVLEPDGPRAVKPPFDTATRHPANAIDSTVERRCRYRPSGRFVGD